MPLFRLSLTFSRILLRRDFAGDWEEVKIAGMFEIVFEVAISYVCVWENED